jgi:hypothetical protein
LSPIYPKIHYRKKGKELERKERKERKDQFFDFFSWKMKEKTQ